MQPYMHVPGGTANAQPMRLRTDSVRGRVGNREFAPFGKHGFQILDRHRTREQIPLQLVATGLFEKLELLDVLHAFSDDFVAQLLGNADDGTGDGAIVGIARNTGGK